MTAETPKATKRSSIFLSFLLGGGFISSFSLLALTQIMNRLWLVPKTHPEFGTISRNAVTGLIDHTLLFSASNRPYLALFLLAVFGIGLGIGLGFSYIVIRRFQSIYRVEDNPMQWLGHGVRIGFWVGSFAMVSTLLQIIRVFNIPLIILLLITLIILEGIFISRKMATQPVEADTEMEFTE